MKLLNPLLKCLLMGLMTHSTAFAAEMDCLVVGHVDGEPAVLSLSGIAQDMGGILEDYEHAAVRLRMAGQPIKFWKLEPKFMRKDGQYFYVTQIPDLEMELWQMGSGEFYSLTATNPPLMLQDIVGSCHLVDKVERAEF